MPHGIYDVYPVIMNTIRYDDKIINKLNSSLTKIPFNHFVWITIKYFEIDEQKKKKSGRMIEWQWWMFVLYSSIRSHSHGTHSAPTTDELKRMTKHRRGFYVLMPNLESCLLSCVLFFFFNIFNSFDVYIKIHFVFKIDWIKRHLRSFDAKLSQRMTRIHHNSTFNKQYGRHIFNPIQSKCVITLSLDGLIHCKLNLLNRFDSKYTCNEHIN